MGKDAFNWDGIICTQKCCVMLTSRLKRLTCPISWKLASTMKPHAGSCRRISHRTVSCNCFFSYNYTGVSWSIRASCSFQQMTLWCNREAKMDLYIRQAWILQQATFYRPITPFSQNYSSILVSLKSAAVVAFQTRLILSNLVGFTFDRGSEAYQNQVTLMFWYVLENHKLMAKKKLWPVNGINKKSLDGWIVLLFCR